MKCISPIRLKDDKGRIYYVPCQKCAWCRKSLRDQWVFRLQMEKKFNPYARFLTLTYDDDHIKFNVDDETGVMTPTLSKSDIGEFHKALWNAGFKFRFLVSGEYGPKTFRPHYHGVYFSKERIPFLDFWKNGANCTDYPAKVQSFKYVLKYVLKGGFVPEGADPLFHTMSRRPGLGSQFNYKGQEYVLTAGGVKVVPGRYYQKRYEKTLDSKLKVEISTAKMEYMFDRDPDADLRKLWLARAPNMDFDTWKSIVYELDNKRQFKINRT